MTVKRTTTRSEAIKTKAEKPTAKAAERQPAVGKQTGKASPLTKSGFAASAAAPDASARTTAASSSSRLLDKIGDLFGGDSELDNLSKQVTDLKKQVMGDGDLSATDLQQVLAKLKTAEQQYGQLAAKRGYPVGELRPTTPEAFKLFQEQQEIHFEFLAGKDLKGGALGDLKKAVESKDKKAIGALATKVAADLTMSSSPAIAKDKMGLLRATLAQIDDPKAQRDVIAQVRAQLATKLGQVGATAISLAAFDQASKVSTAVSVHQTQLPKEVKGTDKIFPNKPLPGWEASNRAAVKAGFDDMEKNGTLFISKIPAGQTAKVAVKLDLNVGLDGPPSVSDPAGTAATVAELLERADKDGKTIRLTVGDSSGFENGPLGRTTMDVMRDTGNYHYALKAGLQFEVTKGVAGAAEALAKIEAAEKRGVFFGSKDDKVSTPADLAAVEQAARNVVETVDYDKAGFVKVTPELGPIGLAAHGTQEFQMAKTWVEADFRVHVARGLSNHILANYTGAQKGLIGLHAIGLRPLDQGNDKRGQNPIDVMNLITKTTAPGTLFSMRSGTNIFDDIKKLNDKGLEQAWAGAVGKWDDLKGRGKAYDGFKSDIDKLQKDLNKQRDGGLDVPVLMERMRAGIRTALEKADATSPGFKQQYWDTAHESTRVALRAGWALRGLIPDEIKDEQIGARIGLLSQLPYQSDLVVQTQPKIGEGGGPDAYQHVRDVGAIIVGTKESATDATAWQLAGKKGSMWTENYPARFGLVYGTGPMNNDEISRLDR